MNDEIEGPSQEDMGLNADDLRSEQTETESMKKSPEELSGMAEKVFRDEPDRNLDKDKLEKISEEAGRILERYNFGSDLDDQFHADIVRLAGEKVDSKVEDIPSKLQAGLVSEEQLKDLQNAMENKEKWWVEAAYRLLRERQGNPVDDRDRKGVS